MRAAMKREAHRIANRSRGLGDLPEDLARERLTEPPILNDRRIAHPADEDIDRQIRHGQLMNNYLAIVGTANVLLFPYNPERAYLLIVNSGANTVFLGFSRDADVNTGLPIAGSGGFYEPILGCVSAVSAISTAGPNNLIVVEGFYLDI